MGLLALAVVVSALGTLNESHRLNQIRDQSRTVLRPAQLDAQALATALFAQESGQQSFLLSGDRLSLAPFTSGASEAAHLIPELKRLLADDKPATAALARVEALGLKWRSDIALPQIAARDLGTIPSSQLVNMALAAIPFATELSHALDALTARIAMLLQTAQGHYNDAQTAADVTTSIALAVALFAVLLSLLLLLKMLTRPLLRLREQISQVADGSYDRVIVAGGPREIAMIAESVETMRENLIANAGALVAANEQMVLRDERDRIAADLHDMTIQRVFGIGLMVRALGQRHPELLTDVDTVVEASDETIRELRNLIFGFRAEALSGSLSDLVRELAAEGSRALGFTPEIDIDLAVDRVADEETAVELLAALREVLSNIARHAHAKSAQIELRVLEGNIQLEVTDDGIGLSDSDPQGNGHANLLARAARLGGSVSIARGKERGTVVQWQVPAH